LTVVSRSVASALSKRSKRGSPRSVERRVFTHPHYCFPRSASMSDPPGQHGYVRREGAASSGRHSAGETASPDENSPNAETSFSLLRRVAEVPPQRCLRSFPSLSLARERATRRIGTHRPAWDPESRRRRTASPPRRASTVVPSRVLASLLLGVLQESFAAAGFLEPRGGYRDIDIPGLGRENRGAAVSNARGRIERRDESWREVHWPQPCYSRCRR
jgi:hypothetical protein